MLVHWPQVRGRPASPGDRAPPLDAPRSPWRERNVGRGRAGAAPGLTWPRRGRRRRQAIEVAVRLAHRHDRSGRTPKSSAPTSSTPWADGPTPTAAPIDPWVVWCRARVQVGAAPMGYLGRWNGEHLADLLSSGSPSGCARRGRRRPRRPDRRARCSESWPATGNLEAGSEPLGAARGGAHRVVARVPRGHAGRHRQRLGAALVTAMQADGIDVTDGGEVRHWIDGFNAAPRPPTGRVRVGERPGRRRPAARPVRGRPRRVARRCPGPRPCWPACGTPRSWATAPVYDRRPLPGRPTPARRHREQLAGPEVDWTLRSAHAPARRRGRRGRSAGRPR